ncbi:MAG TPA: polyprenyl synthetase family protein [Petrotogaceae bacterium]|nr:polyprenyl synthetase family protein [Petrotogaceae bacterium]
MPEDIFSFKQSFDSYLFERTKKLDLIYDIQSSLFYSLSNGGKRLRPYFLFLSAQKYNLSRHTIFELGCAIEILHTSSLIHDDLPAIDNSDFRRSMPSSHRRFNEYTAILTGDFGFTLPLKILDEMDLAPDKKAAVISYFIRATIELFTGETQDVIFEKENREVSPQDIIKMYECKTGSLFGLCLCLPSIICSESSECERLYHLGKQFGIFFQIMDDLDDIHLSSEQAGKDTGKDGDKKTLLSQWSEEKVIEYSSSIYSNLVESFYNMGFFKLSAFISDYGKNIIERVRQG